MNFSEGKARHNGSAKSCCAQVHTVSDVRMWHQESDPQLTNSLCLLLDDLRLFSIDFCLFLQQLKNGLETKLIFCLFFRTEESELVNLCCHLQQIKEVQTKFGQKYSCLERTQTSWITDFRLFEVLITHLELFLGDTPIFPIHHCHHYCNQQCKLQGVHLHLWPEFKWLCSEVVWTKCLASEWENNLCEMNENIKSVRRMRKYLYNVSEHNQQRPAVWRGYGEVV